MLPKEEIREKDEKFATISSISTHSNDFRVEESEQTSDKPQNCSVKCSRTIKRNPPKMPTFSFFIGVN